MSVDDVEKMKILVYKSSSRVHKCVSVECDVVRVRHTASMVDDDDDDENEVRRTAIISSQMVDEQVSASIV